MSADKLHVRAATISILFGMARSIRTRHDFRGPDFLFGGKMQQPYDRNIPAQSAHLVLVQG